MHLCIAYIPHQTFVSYEMSSYTLGSLGIANCVDLREYKNSRLSGAYCWSMAESIVLWSQHG